MWPNIVPPHVALSWYKKALQQYGEYPFLEEKNKHQHESSFRSPSSGSCPFPVNMTKDSCP
jgi:hypothetical protein